MTTALSFVSGRQITNDGGTVQSGAKLYFYRESTTTALTVWTDDAASVAHANPVVCDAGGFVPLIYIDDTYDYKVVIKTSADVTLKTYDNIPAPEASSTTGYFPTLMTWITRTNAQSPVALTAADAGNAYEADTTAGNVEFDLPSAASVGNGKGFHFKKIAAANTMTVDQSGTETIDDSSTAFSTTTQYEVLHIVSNGAEWYIAGKTLEIIPAARLPAASDTATGIQENAIQSEMETASSTTLTVVPGRQHFHPGHPKAGGNFDGTGTPAFRSGDYGMGAITDNGVGEYTLALDTAFSDTNYWVVTMARSGTVSESGIATPDVDDSKTTSSYKLGSRTLSDAEFDSTEINVVFWGDYA